MEKEKNNLPNDSRPMRQIIIETDGTGIFVRKNEVSTLELYAILVKILNTLNKK